MKTIQKDKVLMVKRSTKTMSDAPPEIKEELPGIQDRIDTLEATIVLIEDKVALQLENLTGIAVEKQNKKNTMVDLTYASCKKTASMAFNENIPVLLNKVNKTRYSIARLNDFDCAAECRGQHDVMFPYLTQLLPYGVTATKLATLDGAVNSFTDYINEPQESIDERKAVTASISALIADCDAILVGTDIAIDGIQDTQPEFVAKYKISRQIRTTGGRVLSLRGKMTKADGTPLKGVKIEIVGTHIVKRSTDKGNFQVRHLDEAVWEVKCTKSGFRDFKTTVAITNNERTELVVVMEEASVMV